VPDEDHPNTLVPLFNISAAATGVDNGWQRKAFSVEAMELIRTDPAMLVSAYLESGDRNRRAGYLDTLRQAGLDDIAAVQQAALTAFAHAPELTPLVGLTAVATADSPTVRQLLLHGDGEGLSAALRELDQRLPPLALQGLLTFAVEEAPPVNAALAIAAWWPSMRHVSDLRDLLVEKLADPELGSASALALATDPDIQTIRALQLTAKGDTVAARRARMALDINREQLTGGMRP